MTDNGSRRPPLQNFRDLEVYQRGREAVKAVYAAVAAFPDHERYDLTDQMRRATKSVTTNIAEGWAKRASAQEFKRYLRMSLGSATEMEAHIETACDLGYLKHEEASALIETYQIIERQLERLIQSWRTFDRPSSGVRLPSSRAGGER